MWPLIPGQTLQVLNFFTAFLIFLIPLEISAETVEQKLLTLLTLYKHKLHYRSDIIHSRTVYRTFLANVSLLYSISSI